MKVTFIKDHQKGASTWAAGTSANILGSLARQFAAAGIVTIDDETPAVKTGISPDDEGDAAEEINLEALADLVADKVEEKRQENSFFGKKKKK